MQGLRQSLETWTEIDVAAFHAGAALGIIPPPSDGESIYSFGDKKWIFWTENPLGNMLFDLLENMVTLNILEKHKGDDHLYRWNTRFEWEAL
ncbi:MAG: hypothetical protein ABJN69_07980 [Hellea sp.]